MTDDDAGAAADKVYLVSIYPIPDYLHWKSDLERRRRALARLGVSRHWILRGVDDTNEVMTVFELPSRGHAEQLLRSDDVDVRAWMDEVGLEIYPPMFLGQQAEVSDYPVLPPRPAPSAE